MSDTDTIAAYRAAAATLAEALAAEGPPNERRIQEAATLCGAIRGARWITEAARLRLLADALLLEQEGERAGYAYEEYPCEMEMAVDLSSLVREWATTAATTETDGAAAPAGGGAE